MDLPVMPPVVPMLATPVGEIPPGLHYEPKWDGFRAVVFRDGDEVEIGSRTERPLTRYFPEVVEAVRAALPPRCVVDGELVIERGGGLDFEALLARIHPAASRVASLARGTPASFVVFDVLAIGDQSLVAEPFERRRSALEAVLAGAGPPVRLTPATGSHTVAAEWFDRFEGAGVDGIVAKGLDLPYLPGERAMKKIKHARTADCVVGGFRWHARGGVVGSLLLGLYDDSATLHHVGVASAFPMERRRELVTELAPYRARAEVGHPWTDGTGRRPGGVSRWTAGKDLSWEPVRAELVCEVGYDHLEGERFRHTARFLRWRPDRAAGSCGYAQLERPGSVGLGELWQLPGAAR
ncbi:MAG: ATP-dependent DNA ligase [Mycobacteriales bacterium]